MSVNAQSGYSGQVKSVYLAQVVRSSTTQQKHVNAHQILVGTDLVVKNLILVLMGRNGISSPLLVLAPLELTGMEHSATSLSPVEEANTLTKSLCAYVHLILI